MADLEDRRRIATNAIEEASDTVPLLSCDSDSNSGYHEVSNHFTNILHTTNPQEVASIREDRYMIGHADPYDALGVKETAWEILEPTLRFKGARNATRAYLWASRSSRPAPEFDLPIQGEDLLGYKMADWETLVEWAQVVKIRFGTRSPRRNFYLLRSQFPTETGRRDRGNEYIRRHIFREPRGGTETIAIDRESSRDLPEHELFPDGPEGEVPVPGGPLPLDDEPGYDDLLGIPG